MQGRIGVGSILLTLVAFAASAQPGCNSTPKAVGLGNGCSLNSDCSNPLVCVFGLCHEACEQTRDCPAGQSCVASGTDNVCTLPGESSCTDGTCQVSTLVCDPSTSLCRNPCVLTCPVGGQLCQRGICEDPASDAGFIDVMLPGPGGPDGSVGDATVGDGPMEVGPPVDAGPLGFVPSNLPLSVLGAVPDGSTLVTATCTSGGNSCPFQTPTTIMQNDGSLADLYVVAGLTIDTTATLTFTGSNPVIIASLGPVVIDGQLSVAADYDDRGAPGGFDASNPGPGVGQIGAGATAESGGGGASYCGVGGMGIDTSGNLLTMGGKTYGGPTLSPLMGGSAGGGGQASAGGGTGGGALQLVSSVSITVGISGVIDAGGGGAVGASPNGGGSGGGILLEAPTVSISGVLAANGGAGGGDGSNALTSAAPATGGLDQYGVVVGGSGSAGTTIAGGNAVNDGKGGWAGGGGGAGYIRINTSSGSATVAPSTAIISPDPTTACFSQGKIGG